MEPEDSLHEPATAHYPEPAESIPQLYNPCTQNSFYYYPSIYSYIYQVISFLLE
jgi:hypothetical protein